MQNLNKQIDEAKPWELAKNGETEKVQSVLQDLEQGILEVAFQLQIFLPETSAKITAIFSAEEVTPPAEPLFPKAR